MTADRTRMVHQFGDLEIDTGAMAVRLGGVPVPLNARPYALLELLVANRDRVVTKDEILQVVWEGRVVSDAALTTAVRDIRKAIGDTDTHRRIIRTYYGRGLRFVAPPESAPSEAVPDVQTPVAPATPSAGQSQIRPVVAILPFQNLSEEAFIGHMAQGLADDVIAKLYKFRDLTVVARQSSFAARQQDLPVKDVADKLQASFLVDGTIRHAGTGLRVVTQLIDTAKETLVWADTYELPPYHQSDGQDAITTGIATSIVSMLNQYQVETMAGQPVEKLTAWQSYLRGRDQMQSLSPGGQSEAIGLFQNAIRLAPDFADAYAALSYALCVACYDLDSPDRRTENRSQAWDLALQAIEMNPRISFAWVALARVHVALGQIDDALAAANKALTLNPNIGWAHYLIGMASWQINRPDEALAAFDLALTTSPEDVHRWAFMAGKACALIVGGRYDEAITLAREAQVQPGASQLAYVGEICALGHLGRLDEGAVAIERAKAKEVNFSLAMVVHDYPLNDDHVRHQIIDGLARAGLT